ncbi:MAG: tetratricopeptide repeat protein [Sinobacteraceae bacterium]|nr:tetratricopeptide repeat protein [Nevskiaceae bacterium]
MPQPLTVQPASPAAGFPQAIGASDANAAVIALYKQAQSAQAAGQFGQAASAYERAMRLAPRNAFVWSALARLHLQMQQPLQAINKARKSNSLADGNPYVLQANWNIIATAENATGDSAAARQASAEANKYAKLTTTR